MRVELDGGIINPGDMHGRVLSADHVELSWDGNLICALVGPDLVVGVSGFGDTAHTAIRELADHPIAEAVWVEISAATSEGFAASLGAFRWHAAVVKSA
jgi:hypothetical protein